MIFGKNKEQTRRRLQFKFDPLPAESTTIRLFHQRWIKTFNTQPFDQLYIKYGLVFYKNDLVQFCNNYLGGPSKKPPFGHSKNGKLFFRPKKMKTSLGNIVCHFPVTWPHIMAQCEGFPIFWFFLNILCPFQNATKTAGMTVAS